MVFCTEFLDGWRSWEKLHGSCVWCGWDGVVQLIRTAPSWVVCTVQMGWCCVTQSHSTICTVHTTHTDALKTTTHPKTWCREPYAATQHLMLLVMGVCTRNMSIKLPCCIKLAFHIISWGRCTVKQPSNHIGICLLCKNMYGKQPTPSSKGCFLIVSVGERLMDWFANSEDKLFGSEN